MILGLAQRHPAPRPTWLSALGLQGVGPDGRGVHLSFSGKASGFADGSLSIACESTPAGRQDATDSAAIASAYRRFGPGCVRHLGGRFCFLLHDLDSKKLLAASSTAPPWPLAYWSDPQMTVVSSRLLPMLRCPDAPRRLDDSYLVHLIMGLSAMAEGSTAIRGVRRLCPGDVLLVDSDGVRVSRVDRLDPRALAADRGRSGHLFVEELGATLGAIARRARSVVSLSGGLDSATLVGSGLQCTERLDALSFIAPALDPAAEIDALRAMERKWPHLTVTRVDVSAASEFELAGDLRDDPPLTPLALLPARLLLWSRARTSGFDVVIEGEGGDEMFAILPTPLDALRRGRLLEGARRILGSSGRRALLEYALWIPLLPETLRHRWLRRRQPMRAHLPAFAASDASRDPVVRQAVDEYVETLVHSPFAERVREWMSAPMVVGAALSRRHLAAGFGLELEWPMLERGILELVLGLHAAHAIRGGPDKPFLQSALAGIVPDEARLAPKDIGLYRVLIPRVLTSRRARGAIGDDCVRARLAHLVRFDAVDAMLDRLASGETLPLPALWQLEYLVVFADWYSRASREYGVD
jgi:asparagine synthetase B (glutamine-hydrolysing)